MDILQDIAIAITTVAMVTIVIQRRTIGTAIALALVGAFLWYFLVRNGIGIAASVMLIVFFGYMLLQDFRIIPKRSPEGFNREVIRTLFGPKAQERWDGSIRRMKEREAKANERGVDVVSILEEEYAEKRAQKPDDTI